MPTDLFTIEPAVISEKSTGLRALDLTAAASLDAVRPVLSAVLGPDLVATATSKTRLRHSVKKKLLATVGSMSWAFLGLGIVVAAWAITSTKVSELPSPLVTAKTLGRLLKDPFHNGGPNDKGIGWQLISSLQRVFFGFGLGALVGVPAGLIIGTSKRAWRAANPVIQLLRPVSPLAWFPIWLYVLKDSPQAAKFVIFITALWPILVNTATAAGSVPPDQQNVARVFKFNKRTYVKHVLIPNAVPGIIAGLRLSMGVAWMVIVAVEMMSVGSGVGAFVWDANNAGDLSMVLAAIILIGLVGLCLDTAFLKIGKRFAIGATR